MAFRVKANPRHRRRSRPDPWSPDSAISEYVSPCLFLCELKKLHWYVIACIVIDIEASAVSCSYQYILNDSNVVSRLFITLAWFHSRSFAV
jgi:hypothetical protein